ncbi:MAG: putative molybdenum carrier protein, partial [Rhodocyclaceae bacterium]|nr:putative molybdenum carrier protein [Rhodocyclaceae bacterium]
MTNHAGDNTDGPRGVVRLERRVWVETARIISGGQTGVDRAALDWAIARGIPHGGWCPKGRLAEDGPIAPRYNLTETESADLGERTWCNVRDSDGTLILNRGDLSGGSLKTLYLAERLGRPCLVVPL